MTLPNQPWSRQTIALGPGPVQLGVGLLERLDLALELGFRQRQRRRRLASLRLELNDAGLRRVELFAVRVRGSAK